MRLPLLPSRSPDDDRVALAGSPVQDSGNRSRARALHPGSAYDGPHSHRDGDPITASMARSESDGLMNSCAEVRRLVFEFLDDELAEPRATSIIEHLSLCPLCKGFFAFERTFLAVLHRRVSIDQAPPELRDRIRSALSERKRTDPLS